MKKISPSHILEVVPLVPLVPRKAPFFSYRAEKDIPSGSVVSIPFGPRNVRGIVWKHMSETQGDSSSRLPFRYKDIEKILAVAFLSEKELNFAQHLSRISSQSLGTVLGHFLPKIFPEKAKKTPQKVSPRQRKISFRKTAQKHPLTEEQKQAIKEILASPNPHTLLFGPSASGKTLVYFELIRKLLQKNGQALVLVPDRAILLQEEIRYARLFGKSAIAVFHPDMKSAERDHLLFRQKSGAIRILLGTRSALFLPFQKLNLVIVDDAGADSYRKKGSVIPYEVEGAAQKLAEIHGAQSLLGSSTPSFEMLSVAQKSGSLVTLAASKRRPLSWHIVNLRLERWKKKHAPISEELGNALAATVARKEQALLFISREGMNSFSICAECRAVFRCPACKKPIRYRKEGDYQCAWCGMNAGTTPTCPACGSISFQHLGAGTERVERDLARRFPNIRTVRYDRKNATKKETMANLRLFLNGEKDVLITTERGIRGWDLPRLSLVGIMDADALLGIPVWDADEIAFRNILSAIGRIGRKISQKKSPDSVFIQTFHPESPIFSQLEAEDLEGFFRALEEERSAFLYPPFGTLTRLVCRMKNEKKLDREINRVFELLQEFAKNSVRKIRISPPSPLGMARTKKFLERHIILRAALSPKKVDKSFEDFLKTLPHEWNVERNFS